LGRNEEKLIASLRRALGWKRLGRWIVGLSLAALSFWLLARDLDWRAVGEALQQADYRWVGLGILGIVATFFARTWRWSALLGIPQASFHATLTALLLGQTLNMLLPARAGDVGRAMWAGRQMRSSAAQALGTVAVEKVWDMLALVLCTVLLLIWMPLPGWFVRPTWGAAVALGAAVVLLWVGLRWREKWLELVARLLAYLPRGWDRSLLPRLNNLADGLEAIRQPRVGAVAALWTVVTWVLGAAVNWAVLAAFDIRSGLTALFLLVVLMAGATLPVPANVGVFEGICVLSLGIFDVPRDAALAIGLVLHLVVIGPPLLATGLAVLFNTLQRRRDESD
jgi:uncharacterized protein (TIRG00374 family)